MDLLKQYGWRRQLPDHRDKVFQMGSRELPPAVDLRPKCPTPYDQGQLGSCTANAIAFLCEYDKKYFMPSRLFIYYNERALEGTIPYDAGANIRDGIKSLVRWGFPTESLWPYDITQFAKCPSSRAYGAAWKEKIKDYAAVPQTLNDMKAALAQGYPIVIGFTVYESFESEVVAKTGIVPMPGTNESVAGGHAVAIVGYDDHGWLVRNSWGVHWGMNGYFSIPFQYFTDPNLASDLWVVRMVP